MRKDALLIAALLAACALSVVLAVQNRRLHAEFAAFVRDQAQPARGDWWPTLDVRDGDGQARVLGRPGAGRAMQVVYFFEPDCPHCRVTAPAIRTLDATIVRGHLPIDLVGVTRAPAATRDAYRRAQHFDFPVIAATSRIGSMFRVKAVPLIVAVDGDGRVVWSHAGELTAKDEVASLMTAARRTDARYAVATKE